MRVHRRGFGFVELDDGSSAFVPPPAIGRLLDGDRVRGRMRRRGERSELRELELVSRERARLVGRARRTDDGMMLELDPGLGTAPWPLVGRRVRDGAWIVARVDGEAARVVRALGDGDVVLERLLVRHGIATERPDFPPPRRLSRRTLQRRHDLRDVPTVTIDAPSSRDLDDAVAALPAEEDGAIRVLVSIADVDALVPEGSPLDDDARRRATSVYLPDRVIPMLPPALSEDALSLLPGRERATVTVEMRIDPQGELTSVDLYESVIRSHDRLSYDQVRDFLDGDDGAVPAPLRQTLRLLHAAVARLATTRAARGGVSLLREEVHIELDPSGEPTAIAARSTNRAHQLIERLMVAANEAVAGWLHERGLPALYRVHDAPEAAHVRQLGEAARQFGLEAGFGPSLTPRALAAFERQWVDRPSAAALSTILGHSLGPARYSADPAPHFGLGAPLYLHFTSPIRRYADLVVHRIVKAYLRGERDQRVGDPALASLGAHVTAVSRTATKAERERQRMLIARWFSKHVGASWRGHVVAIQPFGVVVQLEGGGSGTLALDAIPGASLRTSDDGAALQDGKGKRVIEVGQALEVIVAATDEELGRVELSLKAPTKRRRRRRSGQRAN